MEATSINQVDWKFQKGVARPVMPRKFPFVSGFDLAGEIVELGAGVSEFKPGDKVIAFNFPKGGGLAEYAVASASLTVARPPEVSAAQGACLPIAAVAALRSLQTAGVTLDDPAASPRKNVPVTAASGGVGHFAVQLARLGGHHVTATCGARNLGLVRDQLGADEALEAGLRDPPRAPRCGAPPGGSTTRWCTAQRRRGFPGPCSCGRSPTLAARSSTSRRGSRPASPRSSRWPPSPRRGWCRCW
ncbi:unnamed protein product [Urochloa decumbens]|uniref:Enoyl reductase (ER) domain-containing protein n=1 Tax=Urochloa decumbens TaxID=240449 RepID=A0ABC9G4D3_9POAL